MTTVTTIQGNVTGTDSQSSTGLLDRLLDRVNNVVDALFGPAEGETRHGQPAEAYLFLNPCYRGALKDSDLWDLLTDQRSQPEIEEFSDV